MIIDAHEDIAYNVLTFGRDFTQSVAVTRAHEADKNLHAGECTLGLPELRAGGVGLVFGTLFALPSHAQGVQLTLEHGYRTPDEAHGQARNQLAVYRRLAQRADVRLITTSGELQSLIACRQAATDPQDHTAPVGIVVLMEGADPIRTPEETGWWQEQGVRIVGPAWQATRYCGGTRAPGPLTPAGQALMGELTQAGLILDVSHMAEESFWQALDRFDGIVIASHSNCRAFVSPELADRHLSDEMIRALIDRDGVIGIVFFNKFLVPDLPPDQPKAAVTLADVVRHIDHICQIAGNARHVAIGSDFDGGFGREAIPHELDSVADLPLLGDTLRSAGYTQDDVAAVLGGNWLRTLERALPT